MDIPAQDDLQGLGDPRLAHVRLFSEIDPRLGWRNDISQMESHRAALASALRTRLGTPPDAPALAPIFTEPEQLDGYTRQRVSFVPETGIRANGWLLRPDGIKNPPIMICLQGHSAGAHISIGKPILPNDAKSIATGRDFAVQAVREGFAAFALEQRTFGERMDRRDPCVRTDYGTMMSCDGRCKHHAMTALLLGRTLTGERVHDVLRSIDLLETLDNLDLDRIGCMGQSGGGTITWYASCLEPRIKAAMPSCSLCPYAPSIGSVDHCSDNYLPGVLQDFDMPDLAPLLAPRPLVVVTGKEDPIFPIAAVREGFAKIQAVYTQAGAANACTIIEGNGGHQFYPEPAWPAFHEKSGW